MGLVSQEKVDRTEKRQRPRKEGSRATPRPRRRISDTPIDVRRGARLKILELMQRGGLPTHQGQRSRFYVECVDKRLTYVLLDDASRQALMNGHRAIVEPIDGPVGLVSADIAREIYALDPSAVLYVTAALTR